VVSGAVAALYTVWDSPVDAEEFQAALSVALPGLGGKPAARPRTELELRAADGSILSAERKGDAVVVVVGAPPARADEIRSQVWKGWKVVQAR
jgi:hypothetical protein